MSPENYDNGLRVKTNLDHLIKKGELPGIQYMVMNRTKVLFEYYGGLQDIKNNIPVTPSTTFMLNSSTKTVTAAAILQLVEKGDIQLDSILNSYYPANPYGNEVTVRHLLTHTSGIADPPLINWFHAAEDHAHFDEDAALLKILKKSKRKSRSGEKYRYSNIGYWLLGKIIEKVTTMSYPDYVRKHIIQPLSIPAKQMDFVIPDLNLQAKEYQRKFSFLNLIIYVIGSNKIRETSDGSWSRYKFIYHNGYAYGGLYANVLGVSRFLRDMLQEQPVLFSPQTKQMFFKSEKSNAGEPLAATLGWRTGELARTPYFGKPGGGRGSSSNFRIYPDKGIATVFLANRVEINESAINAFSDSLDRPFIQS